YINGHGDLLGGVVLGDAATVHKIRKAGLRYLTGATLSPMLCFLVLRGLETLGLRVRAQSEATLRVAEWLAAQPQVERLLY
ncbi:PLP-dependent transferase, partial [Xylella fastidiosa subsp. multiplex]|nr:PLP-dependent transferase [Xylella fastidiosa subsp. multiplex]